MSSLLYAICCRSEVAGDVISGESVKATELYTELNFEVATSFSSFRDIKKKSFRVVGGGGHRKAPAALHPTFGIMKQRQCVIKTRKDCETNAADALDMHLCVQQVKLRS